MSKETEYDLAFETFLEGKIYDDAAEALYAVASKAFEAGWRAAGGPPISRPIKADEDAFLRALMEHSK